MTLREVELALEEFFRSIGLDFKLAADETGLHASHRIALKGYDDDIAAGLTYYPNGVCSFHFIFDRLETNFMTLLLLNTFNHNAYGFKAYIDENDYLTIAYEVEGLAAEDVVNFAESVLDDLADDDLKKYLLPLTELTTPE